MTQTTENKSHPYSCHTCKAVDCKLWRQAYVYADQVELICWRCLEAKGYTIDYGKPVGSDQVYDPSIASDNWVPAVPTLTGTWWGYTSVPQWWCEWWKTLPNHSDDCTLCCGSGKLAEFTCCRCSGTCKR